MRMDQETELNRDPLRSVFNGSIDKLKRIDELIKDCSFYAVNEGLRGFKHNLRELYRETGVFMNKDQKKKSNAVWWGEKGKPGIEETTIAYKEDGSQIFDPGLYLRLNKFFFFLTKILDETGVTWARKEMRDGFKSLAKKYGL